MVNMLLKIINLQNCAVWSTPEKYINCLFDHRYVIMPSVLKTITLLFQDT